MKKSALLLTFLLLSAVQCFAQFETIWEKKMPGLATIEDVKFSHNSQMVLCLVPNQGIHLYNANNGELVKDLPEIYQPVFSLDDSHIYGIIGNHIAYINIETGLDESNFQPMDDPNDVPVINTMMSKDQQFFLSTSKDGFKVWDVKTGQIIKSKMFPKNNDTTHDITFYSEINITCDNSKIFLFISDRYIVGRDPKGNTIYRYDYKLNAYDFNTLEQVDNVYRWESGDTSDYLAAFSLSSNCSYYVMKYLQNVNNPLRIYDINTKSLKAFFPYAEDLKFTSDDKYLVTASAYKNLLALYDVESGELLKQRLEGSFSTLDISFDNLLIGTSKGHTLQVKRSSITAIPEEVLKRDIRTYPNPAFNNAYLEIDLGQASQVVVVIRDATANSEVLLDQYLEEGLHVLNLNLQPYSQGAYTLEINIDGTIYNSPITIAR